MFRTAAMLLSITLLTSMAHADELNLNAPIAAPPARPALRLDPPALAHARKDAYQARVLRNAGIALTIIGTALSVASAVAFETGHGADGSIAAVVIGSPLLGVGTAAAIVGVPLWAVGQYRASRADQAVLSLSAGGVRLTF